jgi:polyhydroxybutyrate depolymerase
MLTTDCRRPKPAFTFSLLALLGAAAACSASDDTNQQSSTATGGTGTEATGGSSAGGPGVGGAVTGTGGAGVGGSASGGESMGGSATGGTDIEATGGSSTGGEGVGGAATGGTGTGGNATGGTGTGGNATGGSDPGTGGTGGSSPTSGCGAASWPENGRYTIDIGGTTREYVFTAPDGYDGTTPMRLIFVWHGLSGTIDSMDSQFYSYYGMGQVNDGSAILAAGQGLPSEPGGTDYGWRNTDGEDVAFVRATVDWFSSNFCIDADRIFATGMSYGGVMSNTLGCDMGDVFRAIAPIAGAGPGFGTFGEPTCVGQVASLLIHGTADETVTFDMGEASRDHWLEANHCSTNSSAVAPTEYCVAYSDCDLGYPVHWCVHSGGHTIPDFSAQAIWDFFAQF